MSQTAVKVRENQVENNKILGGACPQTPLARRARKLCL